MAKGKRVLVSAHGNSIRALVKVLDGFSDTDIIKVNIPTGIPLVYEFNENFEVINRYYLGDQETVKAEMDEVAKQGKAENE